MTASPDIGRAVAVSCGAAGWSRSRPRPSTGSAPTPTSAPRSRRLYAVKGRPADHPVIVHLARRTQLDEWAADVPDAARTLAARFWPGPLTLVVPAAGARARRVATGGLDTVGLRVPGPPASRSSCSTRSAAALAAPSANRFGRVSPTTAGAVRRELGDDVDARARRRAVRGRGRVDDRRLHRRRAARPARRRRDRSRRSPSVLDGVPAVGGATRAPGTLASHYAPERGGRGRDTGHTRARGARELGDGRRRSACSRSRAISPAVALPDALVPLARPVDAIGVRPRALRRVPRGRRPRPRRRARGRRRRRAVSGAAVADRLGRAAHGH